MTPRSLAISGVSGPPISFACWLGGADCDTSHHIHFCDSELRVLPSDQLVSCYDAGVLWRAGAPIDRTCAAYARGAKEVLGYLGPVVGTVYTVGRRDAWRALESFAEYCMDNRPLCRCTWRAKYSYSSSICMPMPLCILAVKVLEVFRTTSEYICKPRWCRVQERRLTSELVRRELFGRK